jgi:hypothetical protein
MALIEREAAIDALPQLSEFRPILLEAWEEWLEQPPRFRSKMTGSARATIVHDLIVDRASRRLGQLARLFDKAALKLFVFEERICVRFKKHDQDLSSRNQPTQQVKDFLGQRPLEGIPAVHHLEVGYVLDASETQVVSTNLICPNGHKNRPYWHVELKDEGYQCEVTDLFDQGVPPEDHERVETGARWKTRDSGVVIPFKPIVKPK